MLATKLTARGLVVPSFDHNIGFPIVLFSGANEAGKTTRLNALRLNLLGYIPKLGKLPSETIKLRAKGATKIETGLEFDTGDWVKRMYSKTATGASAKPSRSRDTLDFPPVMLEPGLYFNLSPEKRVDYVFGLIDVGGIFDVDSLLKTIREIRVENDGEPAANLRAELVKDIDRTDREREGKGESVQQWLATLSADIAAKRLGQTQEVTRMTKALEAATQLAEPTGQAYDNSDEIAELAKSLQAINGQLDTAQLGNSKREKKAREIETAKAKLGHVSSKYTLAEVEEKIAALETERKGLPDRMTRDNHHNKTMQAKGPYDVAIQKVRNAEEALTGLEDEKACVCSGCGQKLPKKKLEARKAELQAIIDEWKPKAQTALEAWEPLEKVRLQHETQTTRLGEIYNELTELQGMKANRQEANRIAALEAELAEIPTYTVSDLEAERKRLQEEMLPLQDIKRRYDAKLAREQGIAKATAAKGEAEQKKAVLEIVIEKLEEARGKLVTDAFKSLMSQANEMIRKVHGFEVCYSNGEFGYYVDEHWVSHVTFSGIQEATVYAAISIALAASSPYKVVMFDELGRFQPQRKQELVRMLASAIESGFINQAFLVDWDSSWVGTMPVEVIEV